MRSTFLFFTLLLVSSSTFSQEAKKELTLQDAVLGYYNGLFPENLYGLDWTSSNSLYKKDKDTLLVYQPTKKGTNKLYNKDLKINKNLKDIRRLIFENDKSFHYIQNGECYAKTKNGEVSYNYPKKAENTTLSPTKKHIAYTIENNLYLAHSLDSSEDISEHVSPNIVAGQSIHRNEFGIKNGIFWSNNGEMVAFYEKDETDVHDYPLLNIYQTPGSLESVKYPMAGQPSEYGKVGVYNLKTKTLTYLQTIHKKDDYVTNLTWCPEDQFIYIAELNRGQNHMKWAQYEAKTGKRIKTIFEEKNDKWVEPEYPLYFIPGKNNEFVTFSERDGFMNLYHYNTDGKLLNQITKNEWVTTTLLAIKENTIYFQGTGEDPRELHTYSITLDGTGLQKITTEPGVHQTKLSPNGRYLLDQFSNIENPGTTQVIDIKTGKVNVLKQAKNPLSDYAIGHTIFNQISSTDGDVLYSRMITPNQFDSSKTYPVLIYVYGGPHAQLVTNRWLGGASLWMHWMANQGYLIYTLDGRGSANRGFEFESAIFRNLGQLEMKDQLEGINFLKKKSYVDPNRIAVHGWSYGGFMTASLLTHYQDEFTCGVAGGPVIDWKWYEVMYGERYMGQPQENTEGYAKTSLIQKAKELKDPLLLIHGTSDDVVVMQHNLSFVKACVDAGVQVDFFPYPMHKHNVRGKDRVHLMQKVLNYIIANNK